MKQKILAILKCPQDSMYKDHVQLTDDVRIIYGLGHTTFLAKMNEAKGHYVRMDMFINYGKADEMEIVASHWAKLLESN